MTSGLVKGTSEWYLWAFKNCLLLPRDLPKIEAVCERILKNKARYQTVEQLSGVPWFLIGAIHNLEASGDFTCVLHNGEKIIGTGQKTRLVPTGRGPFSSWESAAVDALKIDGLSHVRAWPVEVCLKESEDYNGHGYLNQHPEENSPYLWACTSMNDGQGKYVADGHFDANAPTEGQVGVAAVLKYLSDDKKISFIAR